MELSTYLDKLTSQADAICSLAGSVSLEQARWRPETTDWSLLEVINHLVDEEREDFRQRLDFILHKPAEPWPPIDPQGWVTARGYSQRDLEQSIQNFYTERERSIAWLKSLESPDLEAKAVAPWGSPLRAGDMLSAWVAHDQLHLRQIIELLYAYHAMISQPYQVKYAGEWNAQ